MHGDGRNQGTLPALRNLIYSATAAYYGIGVTRILENIEPGSREAYHVEEKPDYIAFK